MDIVFEEMKEAYIGEILSIYTHYVLRTTATFHKHALSEAEMREIVLSGDPRYPAYVIRDSGDICGYVLLSPHGKREAYDETADVAVYLKPGSVGRGIGREAVKFIEGAAKERGIHVLVAAICGENARSVSLFERCGYEKCAHYREVGNKFGRRLDVVAYQKIIS